MKHFSSDFAKFVEKTCKKGASVIETPMNFAEFTAKFGKSGKFLFSEQLTKPLYARSRVIVLGKLAEHSLCVGIQLVGIDGKDMLAHVLSKIAVGDLLERG